MREIILGGAIKMIDIYANDVEVDVQEVDVEEIGRIKVIYTNSSSRIVIWLDTEKAGKLKDYLSATLESISRLQGVEAK